MKNEKKEIDFNLLPAIKEKFKHRQDEYDLILHYNIQVITIGNYLGEEKAEVIIPASIQGIQVVGIGNQAFCNSNITKLILPNTIKRIGEGAFQGSINLVGIDIPSSVKYIGSMALLGCISMTSINVDSANKVYSSSKDGVLYNKKKTLLITYPAGKQDKSFVIPRSVKSITKNCFFECTKLTDLTIRKNIKDIGEGFFSYCRSLERVKIQKGIKNIGKYAFAFCVNLTEINIPKSITGLDELAFYHCFNLSCVKFEGTIPSSGFNNNAFYGLGALRSKFYAQDPDNGTPGTYKRIKEKGGNVWIRQ